MFPDAQKLLRVEKQGMETVWEPEPSPRSGRVNLQETVALQQCD